MIPEESFASVENRMQSASLALEELLVTAQKQHCLTVGIYESAKLLNADPDSVVLCVLAADDEEDVALQIHFTLLQSFCCDSGINILRVSGVQRLWQLLGGVDANRNQEESGDLHCMLVTVGLLRRATSWLWVSRCILYVKIQKGAALPLPHLLLCTEKKVPTHLICIEPCGNSQGIVQLYLENLMAVHSLNRNYL
uniref:Growth arrest and DNA damage inducible beta n=1 Tax=Poecilia reticulata TaxID=8081 RepID=A0A3P9P264_POERE